MQQWAAMPTTLRPLAASLFAAHDHTSHDASRRHTVVARRLRAIGILVGLAVTGCAHTPTTPAPAAVAKPDKDPAGARALIASGAVVIDVRTADEFAGGHLADAVNLPVQDLATRLAEVDRLVAGDKQRPIVVYCAAGGRAASAKRTLEANGYSHVVNGGGFDDLR